MLNRSMSNAEVTAPNHRVIGKPFPRGVSGNPAGRPKGARSKFSETFLQAFGDDFDKHGAVVIETVRAKYPGLYLRIAASLLPSEAKLDVDVNIQHEISDVLEAYRLAAELLGADPMAGIRRLRNNPQVIEHAAE